MCPVRIDVLGSVPFCGLLHKAVSRFGEQVQGPRVRWCLIYEFPLGRVCCMPCSILFVGFGMLPSLLMTTGSWKRGRARVVHTWHVLGIFVI